MGDARIDRLNWRQNPGSARRSVPSRWWANLVCIIGFVGWRGGGSYPPSTPRLRRGRKEVIVVLFRTGCGRDGVRSRGCYRVGSTHELTFSVRANELGSRPILLRRNPRG